MKRLMMIIMLLVGLMSAPAVSLLSPVPAAAFDLFGGPCNNDTVNVSDSVLCRENTKGDKNPLVGPDGLFVGVAKIMAFVSGVTAVILVIVAGLKFITAGGDAAKIKSARGTIVDVIIGLMIVALASTIISFVLGKL